MRNWAGTLALFAALWALNSGASRADEGLCVDEVPPALLKQLARELPDWRLPRASDFSAADLKYLERDKPGCFGLTRGDFDGDGRQDLALLLKSAKGCRFVLVGALRRGRSWLLYNLTTFTDAHDPWYLKTAKPGLYKQDESGPDLEGLLELRIPHQGIRLLHEIRDVETEQDDIVYGYLDGRWLKVTVR
jgi:hypothetical protein